jgi:hypothetical protein
MPSTGFPASKPCSTSFCWVPSSIFRLLSFNAITRLHRSTFRDLTQLSTLFAERVVRLCWSLLGHWPQIYLLNCQLIFFEPCFPSLHCLSFQFNPTARDSAQGLELQLTPVSSSDNIKPLSLFDSETVSNSALSIRFIIFRDFSFNTITSIESRTFHGMNQLTFLFV